ncbi:unnamed protein product [Soboliphyme baturini]|uniref:Solute carrier family 12 member 6 n=1 Tax=Soboliphyme baturini TaxID=241478 RepID=A0A183IDG9_9BILA|nr:unnamed protein product [Soboliphyme baturini]
MEEKNSIPPLPPKEEVQRNPSILSRISHASKRGLALYEDDTNTNMQTLATYLKSISGVATDDEKTKKTKLGTLLGVYLPSIQHILGVQMFLRLLWIVGIAGAGEAFVIVFMCCLCVSLCPYVAVRFDINFDALFQTFLTSISISAIATNGKVESGGAYFMISRNLGPEFGGAIGILFYLANTVATSMYLVGGVEILLLYLAPSLPRFGTSNSPDDEQMFNNFRLYGTFFLLLIFIICCFGVKFVQFFAPMTLACVILSIISVFIGAFVYNSHSSERICMLGDELLYRHILTDANGTFVCNRTEVLDRLFCHLDADNVTVCEPYFERHDFHLVVATPGLMSGELSNNFKPNYMQAGEATVGQFGKPEREVTQDITTNFFILLAIFFPSVTGIMTGANMSGDLKNPQRSIPIGTIAAQLTTSIIYLCLVLVYAGSVEGHLLRDKYGSSLGGTMVAGKISWPTEWILLIGSFTSCFGAGLQCLCTAPRLLQSIAKDNLLPFLNPFSVVTKRNEPFRALVVTTLIAEGAILIGGIDYVAPVVDFFFLMSYCFVNLACALQTLLNAPNWRPRFRFYHWVLSIVGALLCIFIMFATHWYYGLVVSVLCAFLYKYIEYKGAKKEWGDGIRGLALATAQYSLLRIEHTQIHPKNWRPQVLVLLKSRKYYEITNQKLLQFASQLKAGRGLTMVATILKGSLSNPDDRQRVEETEKYLKESMQKAKVKGFTEVVLCENVSENVSTVLQCVGMASLRPNTVIVGWPHNWKDGVKRQEDYYSFLDAVYRASAADKCLLVPKGLALFPQIGDQLSGNIDVWWIIHDGGLLILLPFLLKQHRVWRNCKLRIFAAAKTEDNTVKMKEDLQRWVYQLRIEAVVNVVELDEYVIPAYTYERTLQMTERVRLAHDLRLTAREIASQVRCCCDLRLAKPEHQSSTNLPYLNTLVAVSDFY